MKRLLAIGAAALACLAAATTVVASAATRHDGRRQENMAARVLFDCSDSSTGLLRHTYSERVLRIALRRIRGDVAEYTGCTDAVLFALRRTRATVEVGIRRTRHGRLAAGRISLLAQDGRSADVIDVRRGERARFDVAPGHYRARVDGRRGCTVRVRATRWRTASVNVLCPR
jgi:hypothetical protein